MKIGVFDPYLDTLSGGEKYMLSIASCLSSSHEVFIFWDKDKEQEIKTATLRKLRIDLSSVKFYSNIFDKEVSSISRFLESRQFDAIVYLSDGSVPLIGTKLYVHFQFPVEWVNGKSIKTKLKLASAKKIFCNSYFTKHFIDRKFNINSNVLYPPVHIQVSNAKKENVILHVGRFDVDEYGSNYKKQDVMIGVFKHMVDKGLKNWKFNLVLGVKDKYKEELSKLIQMAKGYPIEIIENPLNETLWENYSKAKIYWHGTGYGENLEKSPEKAEHFGISTVEAMGSGSVPVVINAGGQKEIVENNKSGYLWNTLDDLEAKTNVLVKDEKLWEEMSSAAIKKSKIFTGDRFCNDLKNLIK